MDESSATQLLCTLKAKKEEWAYLPLEKKIAFLECILNRAGDWGVVQDFALSHVLARKMDPATNAGSSLLAKLYVLCKTNIGSGQHVSYGFLLKLDDHCTASSMRVLVNEHKYVAVDYGLTRSCEVPRYHRRFKGLSHVCQRPVALKRTYV